MLSKTSNMTSLFNTSVTSDQSPKQTETSASYPMDIEQIDPDHFKLFKQRITSGGSSPRRWYMSSFESSVIC